VAIGLQHGCVLAASPQHFHRLHPGQTQIPQMKVGQHGCHTRQPVSSPPTRASLWRSTTSIVVQKHQRRNTGSSRMPEGRSESAEWNFRSSFPSYASLCTGSVNTVASYMNLTMSTTTVNRGYISLSIKASIDSNQSSTGFQ
jgi:hypothetical protein